jgi:acetyltransferase
VDDSIDLCVVVVPSQAVPKIAEEAGAKKVKVLVVISAGFKEVGQVGVKLERELVRTCKKYGMRLVGPNVLGVIDTFTPLNASFAPEAPLRGNIAFLSQSGALCTAVLDWSIKEGIGFSKFVSLGNKADVEEVDLLPILAEDRDTNVILVYLEGIRDGGRFVDVVREVGRKKPVVILKAGVTEAGTRAVSSHTGSMAGSDLAYDVALKQAGVMRARTTEELFDLAETFSTQPVPNGPNVAIFTNAGGPGILATDACERQGLRLAPISPEVERRLREKLPPTASFHNPIDVLGDASAERYAFALDSVLGSQDVHSGLVILSPQAVTEPEKTAEQITQARNKFPDKPLVTAFLGGGTIDGAVKILADSKIPSYPFPERAVYPLVALTRYGEHL